MPTYINRIQPCHKLGHGQPRIIIWKVCMFYFPNSTYQDPRSLNFGSGEDHNTLKPACVKRPLSNRPKDGFKTDYRLMQVKSIAECSKGSILQYFRPSLSYYLSLRSLFCLFLSGRFSQVLLYDIYGLLPKFYIPRLKVTGILALEKTICIWLWWRPWSFNL